MAVVETTAVAKKALRSRFAARRSGIDPAEAERYNESITARALLLASIVRAQTVHTYVESFRNEVATRPLIIALLEAGKQVVVPVVATLRPPLRHARLDDLSELRQGPLGVWQPAGGEPEVPAVDVVIVPGLAFDRAGNRLGMGGGFYDDFLRTVGAPKVGMTYDELLADRIPTTTHDVGVDIVVTQSRTFEVASH